MTEFCPNCGKPLAEAERGGGFSCNACASGVSDDSQASGRGLLPGAGWNALTNSGPIGAIGSRIGPREADSTERPLEKGIDSEGNTSEEKGAGPNDAAWFSGGQPPPPPYAPDWPSVEGPGPDSYDPDRPPWGVGAAIAVWLASVAAILILPNISVLAWLFYQRMQGLLISGGREQLEKLLAQPRVVLIEVLSLIAAHVITLAIIWAVVTGLGRRPAWQTLGWRWSGLSPMAKFGFVMGVVILMLAVEFILGGILPESKETEFDRLLKISAKVRLVVAILAVFTAPLVEEWVYRGVLYSGLRRVAGVWPSVLVVAALFAGVHFPQYWGAWAGLISISILSLTLTIIRAKTKSIQPCIAVHVAFNAVSSVLILLRHY
jgi:uncharacterized protein